MLNWLKQNLKKCHFTRLQLGQCANNTNKRVKFATRERKHELTLQAEFYRERIVAFRTFPGSLDVFKVEEAEMLVMQLRDYVGAFKIGLQLITSCLGDEVLSMLKSHQVKVFYDAVTGRIKTSHLWANQT